jgi:cytochrome P450
MHMRCTATADTVVRGKKIRSGDKVAMWHLPANCDEEIFNPFNLEVTRAEASLLGFGVGQHSCFGAHLAEPSYGSFSVNSCGATPKISRS